LIGGGQGDPLALVISGQLQITTKEGQQVPLALNRCQRKVFDLIQTRRAAGRPVRVYILKFRQGGVSTLCEAILYALTVQQPNRNALVMADEKPKADYIHNMAKFYHEQQRLRAPAPPRRSNARTSGSWSLKPCTRRC